MSGKPFVRRDIWSLPANDPIVTSYAKAVEVMQNRPATDQTSWAYQAAIHGSQAPSPPPLANQCQHQGWYFIAWHRMYLYYFERIVRAAVVQSGGPSDWALPYWNYGLNGRSATLPLPFRNPPTGLPALNRTHKPGINTGATIPPLITSPDESAGSSGLHRRSRVRRRQDAGRAVRRLDRTDRADPAQRHPQRGRRHDAGSGRGGARPHLLASPQQHRPSVGSVDRDGRGPGQPNRSRLDRPGLQLLRREPPEGHTDVRQGAGHDRRPRVYLRPGAGADA